MMTNLEVEVKLIDYLPDFMKENEELKQIMSAEDPEFNLIYSTLKQELYNQFIYRADLDGIKQFEQALGLNVDETLDIEVRRFNLINIWGGELPYTHNNLINKLDYLCGKGAYTLEVNNDEYIVNIITSFIDNNRKNFLLNSLRNIIPANMVIQNSNLLSVKFKKDVYIGLNFLQYKKYKIGG